MDKLVLGILAAVLLLPIARQVLRVRTILRPPRTPEELRASMHQFRVAAYAVYGILLLVSLGFDALFFSSYHSSNFTDLGRYLAWTLAVTTVSLIIFAPFGKRWLERFLVKMQESDLRHSSQDSGRSVPAGD